jgi:hypothetical protein
MKIIRNAALLLLLLGAPAASPHAGLFSPDYKFIPVRGQKLGTWQPQDLKKDCTLNIGDGGYACREVAAGDLRLIFVTAPVPAQEGKPNTGFEQALEVAVARDGATAAERSALPRQIVSGRISLPADAWIPYAVAVDGRSLYVVYSDNRQMWLVTGRLPAGSPKRIDFDPYPVKIMDCDQCAQDLRLAASPSRLHLLRTAPDWKGSSRILYYASAARGDLAKGKARWKERTMSRTATDFGMELLAENNQVYALWSDRRFARRGWDFETNVGKVFIARSTDEGKNFPGPFGVVNKPDDYRDIAMEDLKASLDGPATLFISWSNGFNPPGAVRPGHFDAVVARDLSYQSRP